MTNIPIENTILFSLLIIIFFSIILFLKKISNKTLIIAGIIFILLAINFFYYEFLTDKTSSEVELQSTISNWGLFGSYFGGVVTPILTFITLIILLKQINETQIANNLQIEHLDKTRRIEILISFINELANKTELTIEKQVPLTEELVNMYLKNYDDERSKNLTIKSFENNYKEKTFIVKYSDDKTVDEFDWRNSITYLSMLNKKYEEKAKDNLDNFLKIECHNISVLIKKLIALCTELSNLDENSYQIIKFSLITFTESVEELRKVDLIGEKAYLLFFQLISIHNNNGDSIEEDLKKLFAKELSNKYGKNLTEKDLSTINFGFADVAEDKVGQFITEIDGITYSRKDGNWINEKKF